MKRIVLLVLFLLLTACWYAEKVVEDAPGEQIQENKKDFGKPNLQVGVSGLGVTLAIIDKYCWEDDNKTCNIEPDMPHDLLLGAFSMTVPKGQEIYISIGASNFEELILNDMDSVTMTQFYKGEELQMDVSKDEIEGFSFAASNEPGRYYYSGIIKWDSEVKGEATFAFSIVVK